MVKDSKEQGTSLWEANFFQHMNPVQTYSHVKQAGQAGSQERRAPTVISLSLSFSCELL